MTEEHGTHHEGHACQGPGYASPEEAMKAEREKLLYTVALYVGTEIEKPDYLATVDVDPESTTYSQVVHRLDAERRRRAAPLRLERLQLVPRRRAQGAPLPDHARAQRSSRIHIVDTADPRAPKLHKVIEPDEIVEKTNLTAPHTVHCLADGQIMISMLGDAEGNGPGGFLLLDEKFDVAGRWESGTRRDELQLRLLVPAAAQRHGLQRVGRPEHLPGRVQARRTWPRASTASSSTSGTGRSAKIAQSVDLGEDGLIPLEVRFHHDPDSTHGFVGAALSQRHVALAQGRTAGWEVEQGDRRAGQRTSRAGTMPVPGLITDLRRLDGRPLPVLLQLAARRRAPVRHQRPGQAEAGRPGLVRRRARQGPKLRGKQLEGGPQMLQLSLDGKRLYVTNSLFSTWDNQFYPNMAEEGSYLLQIDCDTEKGGLKLNEKFFVDFGKEPDGPARAHEMRYPGGDFTSDIWI